MNTLSKNKVAVIGTGNAALVAALSAHEAGANVEIFEASTEEKMGGNSRFTFAGFRFGLDSPSQIKELIPTISKDELNLVQNQPYTPDDFFDHLMSTSNNLADKELCRLLANKSFETLKWLKQLGIEWGLCISQVPSEPLWKLSPGSVFVAGRGKGLINALMKKITAAKIPVHYESPLERVIQNDAGFVDGIIIKEKNALKTYKFNAVILACGGFEANKQMRRKHMGESWGNMKVRGTRYNTGKGLKAALALGAQMYGNWAGGHAVPIASDSDNFGLLSLGETTRRCLFQYGISVNLDGKRFMDEGENKKILMYGKTGVAVSSQKNQKAFQIFDAKIMTSNFEKLFYYAGNYLVANTLEELSELMQVPKSVLLTEISEYNAAIDTSKEFNTAVLDGRRTTGITPQRSNFALEINMPPYFAFPVTGGITFTYGGVKVNDKTEVVDDNNIPIPGLYAAGEMTGGFFIDAYPANAGLARGAVTGYLAGKSATDYINNYALLAAHA